MSVSARLVEDRTLVCGSSSAEEISCSAVPAAVASDSGWPCWWSEPVPGAGVLTLDSWVELRSSASLDSRVLRCAVRVSRRARALAIFCSDFCKAALAFSTASIILASRLACFFCCFCASPAVIVEDDLLFAVFAMVFTSLFQY